MPVAHLGIVADMALGRRVLALHGLQVATLKRGAVTILMNIRAPNRHQAANLGERFRCVVHAQVENAIDPGTARALSYDDQNRPRLPSPNITAFGLGSIECAEQPIDELTL